jgi:hypothetical protein
MKGFHSITIRILLQSLSQKRGKTFLKNLIAFINFTIYFQSHNPILLKINLSFKRVINRYLKKLLFAALSDWKFFHFVINIDKSFQFDKNTWSDLKQKKKIIKENPHSSRHNPSKFRMRFPFLYLKDKLEVCKGT